MKIIIFDLDGTLLNSSSGIIKSLNAVTAEFKLPKIEDYNRFIGPPIENGFREYYLLNEDKVALASAAFRKVYADKYLFDAELYAGVTETLKILKKRGYKLAIATNKRESYAVNIIRHFMLDLYCDPCVGSVDGERVTKEAVINECISQMGIKSEHALYVGDTKHDKTGALSAGTSFVAVTWGFGYKPGKTGLNSPVDLLSYLGEI